MVTGETTIIHDARAIIIMNGDGDHFWLGLNPIQPSTNRVTVPKPAFDLELLRREDDAFWGHSQRERYVLISCLKQPFFERPEYTHNFTTKVQENRVVTVPKEFFPDYEGKAEYARSMEDALQFELGETLHFVVSSSLFQRNLCYVLKDKDCRSLIDEEMIDVMTDGGQDVKLEGETRDVFLPEAVVGENEVFHIETGNVLTVDELREYLNDT